MTPEEFTQKREEVIKGFVDMLVEKNNRYGNSALDPIHIFYKGSATNSIEIRLDDKISRIMNSGKTNKNDMSDILGYLILLIISHMQQAGEFDNFSFRDKVNVVMDKIRSLPDHEEPIGIFQSAKTKTEVEKVLRTIDYYIQCIRVQPNQEYYYLDMANEFIKYFVYKDITSFIEQID